VGTSAIETLIGRRNTRALIAEDPRDIVLNRPTRVSDAAGGFLPGLSSLPSQRFRIVPLSGLVWDRSTNTADEGLLADVTHQLIGDADADVKKGDWFVFSENDLPGRYEVMHVSPQRHFRTSANLKYSEDHADLGGGVA
jgi:hypothetical protein